MVGMFSLKRFLPVFFIFAVLGVTPLCAQAAKRIYFAGYLGLNTYPPQDYKETSLGIDADLEFEDNLSFAGAIGFKLTPQIRIEADLSRLSTDINSVDIANLGTFDIGGEIDSTIAMLNVYYDFDFNWKKFQPFVGAGIGYGWHEGGIDSAPPGITVNGSSEADGYVWQVGGGMRYPITETLHLISAYRYVDGEDLQFGDTEEIDTSRHELRLGLSWALPFE